MLERDHRLQAVAPADERGQHHHHGEAGEHRAHDEIRREDRLLPAGHQARREVEADDRMYGADEGHGKRRHRDREGSVDLPVPRRPAPAKRPAPRRKVDVVRVRARSRNAARSGIMPLYQNMIENSR